MDSFVLVDLGLIWKDLTEDLIAMFLERNNLEIILCFRFI